MHNSKEYATISKVMKNCYKKQLKHKTKKDCHHVNSLKIN